MKINDEELEKFIEMFGDQIPDYKHYPRTFMYYFNMFKFLTEETPECTEPTKLKPE